MTFIFIGGLQPKKRVLDHKARACPRCDHFALYPKRVDQYFSLFFIPLFPVKKGPNILECDHCRAVFEAPTGSPRGWQDHEGGTGHGDAYDSPPCGRCGRPQEADFAYCPTCGHKN